MSFEGKVVLITGAATGIGRACMERFYALGASVAGVDMNEEALKNVVKDMDPARVRVFGADVSDEARAEEIVKATVGAFGRLDVLVNNAGLWRRYIPFAETTKKDWDLFVNVNVYGVLYYTHAALPFMKAQKSGRIINLGSVAGVYGNRNMVDYSMTKGAVISFTAALAKEVAEDNITVNCVSPGTVANDYDEPKDNAMNYTGRDGKHSENAAMITFLASEEAAYISGQNIQVDGCRRMI